MGPAATGQVGASQTFKAGDLVGYSTSGQIIAVAAPGSNFASNVIPGTILGLAGVAAEDAPTATNASVKFYVIDKASRWALPVNHGTPASAVTAISQNGAEYVLKNDSALGWCVMIDTATNPVVRVRSIKSNYPIGEQYGLVEVSIKASVEH